MLLIGSGYSHLITPVMPIRLGPPGGPAAVKTRSSWTLQGPTKYMKKQPVTQQCLHIFILSPTAELLQNVESLWQLDVLPYRSEQLARCSRQDQEAVCLLEVKTICQSIQDFPGVFRDCCGQKCLNSRQFFSKIVMQVVMF